MRILALDPGTVTGWHCDGQGGAVNFKSRAKKDHVTDRHAGIFDRAGSWLSDAIDEHRPELLVIERAAAGAKGEAARVMLGLRAVILITARRREIMVDEIPSSEWQAWAKPRGWVKSDENDARYLADWWAETRAQRVEGV